ncbi:MAG: cytochrome b, partial [Alphaproteobacteria bacterium]
MSNKNLQSKGIGSGVIEWIEYRLPIFSSLKHLADYQAPKNLSYAWNFGSLAG